MKVHVLLPWWDESPTWLAACIASCAPFADRIVAVDGAYALYPSGPRAGGSSGSEQHEAIVKAAEAAGLELTLHVPSRPWEGNEIEKRSAMFRIAEAGATPWDDWYFVIDADEVVIEAPADLRPRLAAATELVAEVTLMQVTWKDTGTWNQEHGTQRLSFLPSRQFFRAAPGMRVTGAHHFYCYDELGPDGQMETVWLRGTGPLPFVPALSLPDVLLDHRNHLRPGRRRSLQGNYYQARELAQVERNPEPELAAEEA